MGLDQTASPSSRVMAALRSFWGRVSGPVLTLLALLMIWAIAISILSIPEYLLPSPATVFTRLWQNRWVLAEHGFATGRVIVLGYSLAVVVGIPLALSISFFTIVARTVYPGIVMLQNVPKIAIAPLFVIWFGFGMTPKLLIVFLLAFFPIVVSSIAGFQSLSDDIVDFARSTGAGRFRVFSIIRLPAALPHIFVGLRIAATIAPTAAIVAEFVASDSGLGYLLLKYNGDLNTAMSFAAIISLAVMGVLLFLTVELLEGFLVRKRIPAGVQANT